jgi:hypothetical protein
MAEVTLAGGAAARGCGSGCSGKDALHVAEVDAGKERAPPGSTRRAGQLAGALACYARGCKSRTCAAACEERARRRGGGLCRGGALQALSGRTKVHVNLAKRDPVAAVMHFAAQQRGQAFDPEEVWFSTNHEDWPYRYYQTYLRVITLADFEDCTRELAVMGPERRTPQAAEMGAADALLERLTDYIFWSSEPRHHPLQRGHQRGPGK